ncbi:hypothetical protein C0989_005572 [Termitomyces sp. Mn162]|nr:hypothetical protein C0989_005572 [Termitomyces sp. Mn162]
MLIPVEVLTAIVRQATLVSEVLDTSLSIYLESRDAVLKQFFNSMKTKVSLSLVSETFHSVMEIYLYEVVMIFRFEYVPIVLQRLQSIPAGSTIPRGHRCRRLDFYLGVGTASTYNDEAWYEVKIHRNAPHLTHKALWKTIAACCAKTIRRLELYGFGIRMDRVEMMLRYLTQLEVCSIAHVKNFDPLRDAYDDEEPTRLVIPQGRCFPPMVFRDDWDYSKPSSYFNVSTVSEFKVAKENSCWPPFTTSAPYTLSHLHTLRLDAFDPNRIIQFNFPRLRHLDMYSYFETECLSSSLGSFPDSLTHLTYAGNGASIAQIIGFFPQLRFLILSIEFSSFPNSHFRNPHLCLEVVELAIWDCFMHPQPQIEDIFIAVRAGKLPSLRMIQVTPPFKPDAAELFAFEEKESTALGVVFEVVIREKPLFPRMHRRHHG